MVPRAFSEVACALVGNSIGANDVTLAKRILKIMASTNLFITVFIGTMILLTRQSLTAIFSDDGLVQTMSAEVLILVAFTRVFDSLA